MSKEKILEATAQLMKTEGIEGLTIRKIAELAGTNVALLNYHFGSKDNLINEILKRSFTTFQECFDVLDEAGLSPLQRLKKFLTAYGSKLLEHREVGKFVLSQERMFDSHYEFLDYMKNQGYDKLTRTIAEIVGPQNQDNVFFMLQQMFPAIFFPSIIKGNMNEAFTTTVNSKFTMMNLSIEDQVELFIDHYFHKYL